MYIELAAYHSFLQHYIEGYDRGIWLTNGKQNWSCSNAPMQEWKSLLLNVKLVPPVFLIFDSYSSLFLQGFYSKLRTLDHNNSLLSGSLFLFKNGLLFPSYFAGKLWAHCSAVRRCVWCSSSFSPAQPTTVSVSWENWDWLSSEMWVHSWLNLGFVKMFFLCNLFLCLIRVMCNFFFFPPV